MLPCYDPEVKGEYGLQDTVVCGTIVKLGTGGVQQDVRGAGGGGRAVEEMVKTAADATKELIGLLT